VIAKDIVGQPYGSECIMSVANAGAMARGVAFTKYARALEQAIRYIKSDKKS
jgi:hypothetical protein